MSEAKLLTGLFTLQELGLLRLTEEPFSYSLIHSGKANLDDSALRRAIQALV